MRALRAWFLRLADLFRSERREQDFAEEIESHLLMHIESNIRAGMSPAQARREAVLKLGGVPQTRELYRARAGLPAVESLGQDFRYALRGFRKSPGFSLVAVATLALGIGANTSIFSVVKSVLLQPLPFPEPHQLVQVQSLIRTTDEAGGTSYPDFVDWQRRGRLFQGMAACNRRNFAVAGSEGAERLRGAMVTAGLLPLLGVPPQLGRWFTPAEERPGAAAGKDAVILSHRLWAQRYGADPGIIGRTIDLDQTSFTVVGVMPPGFTFPIEETTDLWVTVAADARGEPGQTMLAQRGVHYLETIARMKPGISLSQARAEMSAIVQGLNGQYPDEARGVRVLDLQEAMVGEVRTGLVVLQGAVGCMLLIACANLAGLLLSRAMSRRREMAIRAALGAGRRRMWQQLAVENLSLCALGGGLAVALAHWAVPFLVGLAPQDIPRLNEVALDTTVLAFSAGTSALVMLLLGLTPLAQLSRLSLMEGVKGGRTQTEGPESLRLRNLLVGGQMALAVALLACAGLLLQSLGRLVRVNPGFDPESIVTFRVDLPDSYPGDRQVRFYNRLVAQLQTAPGVLSASAVLAPPLSGRTIGVTFDVEGRNLPEAERPRSGFNIVQPDYFRTLKIPFRSGRDFTARDDLKLEPVAIVNETLARRIFGSRDPVGRSIRPSIGNGYEAEPMRQIVGVVGDVRAGNLRTDPQPEIYVPLAQCPGLGTMTAAIRSGRDTQSVVAAARAAVAQLDRNIPIFEVRTLHQAVAGSLAQPRFTALLSGLFASVSLLLAGLGLYGVVSYSATRRKPEIGIRLALGAQPHDVVRSVVTPGARLVAIGAAAGVGAALALTRFLGAQLYGVGGRDPLTFFGAVALLALVALAACWFPARRALRVEPITTLRDE
jgi:putative ABC transport system permease protein